MILLTKDFLSCYRRYFLQTHANHRKKNVRTYRKPWSQGLHTDIRVELRFKRIISVFHSTLYRAFCSNTCALPANPSENISQAKRHYCHRTSKSLLRTSSTSKWTNRGFMPGVNAERLDCDLCPQFTKSKRVFSLKQSAEQERLL